MSRRRVRQPKPTTDQRSPEQRLEALVREPNGERASRMMTRIREDLDAGVDPRPWVSAARSLRDRLIISEDSFFYFADIFSECVLFSASSTDAELCRIRDAMEAIEREHGLRESEYWRLDEAPDDWRALNDQWDAVADEIVSTYLRSAGHSDVADLLNTNRTAFERRSEQGSRAIWHDEESDEAEE